MAISLAAAVLLSVGVEFVQLHMADRTGSVIDVLAAATGAGAGAVAANLAARLVEGAINSIPHEFVTGLAGRLLAAIVLTAILIAWWPFDVTLDVSTVLERLRAARAAFWFEDTVSLAVVAKGALFASLGWILARTMRRDAALHRWLVVIGAMAAFAAVLDAGQVLMGSRPAGFVTLCWQFAGIVAGAGAAAASRPAP